MFEPLPLVEGRECGDCNVCCVALTIRDPALNKPQGIRCHNALPDNHCVIYETRPMTCRLFECGWKQLKWVKPSLRPDLSQVLVRLRVGPEGAAGAQQVSVVFTILQEAGLAAEGLAESMAAGVMAQIPIFLEVPGAPGYTAGIAEINPVLEEAVLARDKPAMLAVLRWAWESGRVGDHRKVDTGE